MLACPELLGEDNELGEVDVYPEAVAQIHGTPFEAVTFKLTTGRPPLRRL